jgi:3-isopropylmalate dehydrogenase
MKIAVMPGDGIGREVTAQAVKVLKAVVGQVQPLELVEAAIGQAGIDAAGDPLPAATTEIARKADAILFGSAGMPGDEEIPFKMRPGASLLRLRKELGLFANFRPAFLFPELIGASTLKPEVVDGLDLMILRELTGDVYFGEPRGSGRNSNGEREAFNTMRYSEPEVERIAHVAFRTARTRNRKLCSVDKANVLEVMQLWREVVTRVGKEYPDVELTHLFVDAAAMQLMRAPRQFDVIVTGNIFGDILSDAAAMLTGSIGMLPSASMASGSFGLYEPVHGTAPDIAGKNLANPLASILSVAMMLRFSFDQAGNAERVEGAVRRVLADGLRTSDIFQPGCIRVGTEEMGDAVVSALGRMGQSTGQPSHTR